MYGDQIQAIALDIKKILDRESNITLKINDIEDKINKNNSWFFKYAC